MSKETYPYIKKAYPSATVTKETSTYTRVKRDTCVKRVLHFLCEKTWSTCSKPAAVNDVLLYSALFSRTIVDTLSILKTLM